MTLDQSPDLFTSATIQECSNTNVHPKITCGHIITKTPVVLAEVTVQVNTDFRFTVPKPVLEIKTIGKRLKLTESVLALPTNKLFLRGFVRKNIQFATPTTFTGTTVSSTIESLTVDVPFSCVTDLTGRFITPPVQPRVNTRSEFEFFTSTPLAATDGFAAKDVLSMGDLSEFDQLSTEFFNELPFVELISATFTEFDLSIGRTPGTVVIPSIAPTTTPPPFEEGTFTMIEEKMAIDITLKVLQNQQIRVMSKRSHKEDDDDCEDGDKC
jgi:hypothetical protein